MVDLPVVISLGDVFYLRCNLCAPPKQKFFVVAEVDPLRMFLINSELTLWAKSKPAHVAASPLVLAAHHPFLDYDSYLSCTHLSHEYSHEALMRVVRREPRVRVGVLHDTARYALAAALRMNELIPGKYMRSLRPLWEDWE